jgi:hypothetical protein
MLNKVACSLLADACLIAVSLAQAANQAQNTPVAFSSGTVIRAEL